MAFPHATMGHEWHERTVRMKGKPVKQNAALFLKFFLYEIHATDLNGSGAHGGSLVYN